MQPAAEESVRHPLRGRADELAAVVAALTAKGAGVVVISGPAGAGKSALAEAAVAQPSLAGTPVAIARLAPGGKLGVASLVGAVDALLAEVLEDLFDPEAALETLASTLGEVARAFAEAGAGGPLAELALKAGPAERTFDLSAGAERLTHALLAVLRWVEGARGGLILMIDDWARGGPEMLAFVRRVTSERPRVRVLATERTEEAVPAEVLAAERLAIGPLSPQARAEVVADRLDGQASAATQVLALLGPDVALPFDVAMAVDALRASGALRRFGEGWSLDEEAAALALGGPADARLLRRLADEDPSVALVAEGLALFGDATAAQDLATGAELPSTQVDQAVERLLALGLVRRTRDGVWFAHDRFLAAVVQRLPPESRARRSASLAEALRREGVRPATYGVGAAMLHARAAGASGEAAAWARMALVLARRAGPVAHRVLREAIYAAVAASDHRLGRELGEEMLVISRGARECAEADEMRALVRRAEGDIEAALAVAREALERLGLRLPRRAGAVQLLVTALRVLLTDVERGRRAGPVTAAELEVYAPIMRALNAAGSLLFEQDPMRAMLLAVTGIPPRLVAGTASGAATYSVLCAAFGHFRQGERWARLSDDLQAAGQPMRATALHYATNFGFATVRPRAATAGRIEAMERVAYAEGDLAVLAYANRRRALDALFSDMTLAEMTEVLDGCLRTARRLSDQPTLVTIAAMRQLVANLADPAGEPWRLDGDVFDAAAFSASPLAAATHAPRHIHMLAALGAALGGAWEAGVVAHDRSRRYFKPPALQLLPQVWFFATGLALLRTGRRLSPWRMAVLQHHAAHNPTDQAHRVWLLRAERLRGRGATANALSAYEHAVQLSRTSRCALEHGLVAAVSASGAKALGRDDAEARFASERDGVWTRLGAHALLRGSRLDAGAAAAAELRAGQAAAERMSRAKSRLLAEVAHELRTPLQGAVDMLTGDADPEALRQSLRHLATVVDDLADLGALDAGGLVLSPAPFDVETMVRQVAAMHARQAGPRRLRIHGEGPGRLVGDEVRLRQVLSNLLSNALKHGAGDVNVTLAGRSEDAGAELTIEVADEGEGVDSAQLATIFEPFRRGGASDAEGLGLGLPIARRIARAMGGDLTAHDLHPGVAFRLKVRLPRAGTVPRAATTPGSILLAEDVDLSRRTLAALLAAEGWAVVQAADGHEALAAVRRGGIDMVLTDERMPGLFGSELAHQLREDGFQGRIAIAAGADEPGLRARIAPLADVVVLRKPVDPPGLRAWFVNGAQTDPVVRLSRIDELRDALGDAAEAAFAELRDEVGARLADVQRALREGGAPNLRDAAHRLGGLAEHFGLAQTAAASRSLEAAARDGAEAPAHVARLEDAIAAIDWAAFGARALPQVGSG